MATRRWLAVVVAVACASWLATHAVATDAGVAVDFTAEAVHGGEEPAALGLPFEEMDGDGLADGALEGVGDDVEAEQPDGEEQHLSADEAAEAEQPPAEEDPQQYQHVQMAEGFDAGALPPELGQQPPEMMPPAVQEPDAGEPEPAQPESSVFHPDTVELLKGRNFLNQWFRDSFAHLPCFEAARFTHSGVFARGVPITDPQWAPALRPWYTLRTLLTDYMESTAQLLSTQHAWPFDSMYVEARLRALLEPQHALLMPFVARLVIPADSEVAIFGDLHGSLHSLLRQLALFKDRGRLDGDLRVAPAYATSFFMVFCGDYVDRGFYGVETLSLLLTLRLRNPDNVFLVRGNHEDARMNEHDVGGTFLQELRTKYPDVPDEDLAAVFKVYDTLPQALFLGVGPTEEERLKAYTAHVDSATRAAAAAAEEGTPLGTPIPVSPAEVPVRYMLCAHGGIEFGYDARELLATPGGAMLTSQAKLTYAIIHGIRRRDWYETAPHALRRKLNPRLQRYFVNYGSRIDQHGEVISDEHARPFPVPPTEMDPPNGFMWFDFFVHDNETAMAYNPGRGMIVGQPVARQWLEDNGVVAVLRAHQHNDQHTAGPMLKMVREAGGLYDNWGGSGMVLTFLSGAHIPALRYPYDSFGLFSFPSADPSTWYLDLCNHQVTNQFVQRPHEEGGGWVDDAEPPPWLRSNARAQHVCDPDLSFTCAAHPWKPAFSRFFTNGTADAATSMFVEADDSGSFLSCSHSGTC